MAGRRDLSGNAYQLSAERAAIEIVARRYGIPFWQAEMALATDPNLMRGIINDAIQRSQAGPGALSQTANPAGAGQVQDTPTPPVGGDSGWAAFTPIASPPGQDAIERIANAFAPHGPKHGKKPEPEKKE